MRRTRLLWLAFLICLAVVLTAMGWISAMALRLEEAEAQARRRTQLEERVRSALWRMDTALAPILAGESARPHFAYKSFFSLERAYGKMFNRAYVGGEILVPSPLLTEESPYVLVHFEFEPDGRLTSPRDPPRTNRDLALSRKLVASDSIERARAGLQAVARLTDRGKLIAVLPQCPPVPEVVVAPWGNTDNRFAQQQPIPQQRRAAQNDQQAFDYNSRSQVVQNTSALAQNNIGSLDPAVASTDLGGALMSPLWIDGHLLLARRVSIRGEECVQGCLLDWETIRGQLLDSVSELLPGAALEPVTDLESADDSRLLAALPVRLVPAALPIEPSGPTSPIRLALIVAWACVLVAAAAVAALLFGVVRLSERRAAFVTAVTHELRTPLTTFHMYTEMLSEGMVRDASQRQTYLDTLRIEASRLSHLVENVLAYARLERGRTNGRIEAVAVERLLAPADGRLADRAQQAGMELLVEADDAVRETAVEANPSAVEQVLFNLVDNACKYASGAADKRIHLVAERNGRAVRLTVRDHGPGVNRPMARRLFRPFSKTAHEAANSAPGVGLGLALSKRLARDMGGKLQVEECRDGACFVLTLPVAP
jgi:signal transduction histidine kinase